MKAIVRFFKFLWIFPISRILIILAFVFPGIWCVGHLTFIHAKGILLLSLIEGSGPVQIWLHGLWVTFLAWAIGWIMIGIFWIGKAVIIGWSLFKVIKSVIEMVHTSWEKSK